MFRHKIEEIAPILRYCIYKIGDSGAGDDLLEIRTAGRAVGTDLDSLVSQTRAEQAKTLQVRTSISSTKDCS